MITLVMLPTNISVSQVDVYYYQINTNFRLYIKNWTEFLKK